MSEQTTEAVATDETEAQEAAQTTETETDWKAASRKWEARAKEHKAALDAAQAEAARVKELETQLSTFTEEAGTKEAAAKAAVEKANLEIARLKVRAKYGLSEDETELFLTATDPEVLDKQGEALSKRTSNSVKPDSAQGNRTGAAPKGAKADFDAWHQNFLNN